MGFVTKPKLLGPPSFLAQLMFQQADVTFS